MVGDDWQAVLLWKALFDAGVYTNVAIHPAVPPGGALLRTSLMATHEREHLDGALGDDRPHDRGLPGPSTLLSPSGNGFLTSPVVGSFSLVRMGTRSRWDRNCCS